MLVNIYQQYEIIPWSTYMELIKIKQTTLLLLTGLFAYLISGYPDNIEMGQFTILITSLFFSIAGSTMLNMWWDRDIDAKMERTKNRALPMGKVTPTFVFFHGLIFSFFGVVLALAINLLCMLVIFGGLFFDVVIYTILLKRRTKWSIIFGGISGGIPAVAGRIAITNQIDEVSIIFLLIILLWIPMHILSLALLPENIRGYSEAAIPMWPISTSIEQTRLVITISAFLDALVLVYSGYPLRIHLITHIPLYVMGLTMTILALKNLIRPSDKDTFNLFKFASIFMAITYLWLFIAVVITPRIPF